jgi:hypothetical protein
MPLTCHYLLELAQSMKECGLSKRALEPLVYARMLVLVFASLPSAPEPQGVEAFLTLTHLRALGLLKSVGLEEEATLVHNAVGNAVVSAYIKQRVGPAVHKQEPISDRVTPFGFFCWTAALHPTHLDASTLLLQVRTLLPGLIICTS